MWIWLWVFSSYEFFLFMSINNLGTYSLYTNHFMNNWYDTCVNPNATYRVSIFYSFLSVWRSDFQWIFLDAGTTYPYVILETHASVWQLTWLGGTIILCLIWRLSNWYNTHDYNSSEYHSTFLYIWKSRNEIVNAQLRAQQFFSLSGILCRQYLGLVGLN